MARCLSFRYSFRLMAPDFLIKTFCTRSFPCRSSCLLYYDPMGCESGSVCTLEIAIRVIPLSTVTHKEVFLTAITSVGQLLELVAYPAKNLFWICKETRWYWDPRLPSCLVLFLPLTSTHILLSCSSVWLQFNKRRLPSRFWICFQTWELSLSYCFL